ncbi:MAG: iron-only hydrogenase system regulator [Lachnospiraceae bacterium]|nr:iron-only hydrogenase system regulator [Lachnospiraceae bacterium]
MKKRVAVISIILEDVSSVEKLNSILSQFRERIIGRMGLPYREKNVNIICVAIDAPEDEINSMTGKIGKLKGVSAKTNYSNVTTESEEI